MENQKNPNFNPATFLTISRFFLVPVFIYFFLVENFTAAVITLIIASVTDVVDGLLARRFNMGTTLGSVLDPLADKFLMMISFIVLTAMHILPVWLTMIVIGRDFYIVFGLMYLYYVKRAKVVIKPSILSKRTTFAQFLLLTFSFIKSYIISSQFHLSVNPDYIDLFFQFQMALIYITGVMTLITFGQYTWIALGWLKQGPRTED